MKAPTAPIGTLDEGMNVRQFIAESYPGDTRDDMWREVLAELHLRSLALEGETGRYSSAILRGDRESVILARLVASSQALSSIPQRSRMLMGMIPLDADVEVTGGNFRLRVDSGALVVLQMDRPWEMKLPGNNRILALGLSDAALQRRGAGWTPFADPRCYLPKGLASVFIRAVESAAAEINAFSAAEWQSFEQFMADLFVTMIVETESADMRSTPSLAALFNRMTVAIEKRLHDPDLSSARVARVEGISERYLQKLFEQNGESFTHYLRERRLQRARAALVTSAEVRLPVADVAYSCGFGDAANFNRVFKERFGLPPGAFRNRHLESQIDGGNAEQRGWPVKALTAKKSLSSNRLDGTMKRDERAPEITARPATVHHKLSINASNVHWGYFSRSLEPVLEISSGDTVEIETLSQHASDAPELMIEGDGGAEDVFHWTEHRKSVDRRGAGPVDASIFGRGAGEGFGVHICTGPIYVKDAEPGDVIEVHIEDMLPRPSRGPGHEGRYYGSNVAAWWGYHYGELLTEPKPRENITIYEVFPEEGYAQALYSYPWAPQTDPFGVVHRTYDYPGVLVKSASLDIRRSTSGRVHIPLRPHFGVIALAPREVDFIDSVPPAYFGGNLDNWRLGKGASVFLPVSVHGGLLSIGDPHAAQGDGELSGTAIECSMTGRVRVTLHKKDPRFSDLTYPLIETPGEWVLTGFSHPDYLAEFGAKGQGEVYAKSSLDLAMKDAFRKARRFLMSVQGLGEDEAIAVMSAAVDFGVTQVVDGNWGVHAIIRKAIFETEQE
ncbi:acetamidase/formamidase family protein [Rhizobium sp. 18065]|uniref:acetamidase/formamidase family protein n=1 Tax=Rhizobium sp. 18065 TaxID=2681411 RepID=UPI001FCECEA1|nr:acetamidase/formamidase family protein [Rhizobium sp. 18065]